MRSAADETPIVLIDARMVSAFEHGISRYVTDIATGFAQGRTPLPYQPVFLLNRRETTLRMRYPWTRVPVLTSNVGFLNLLEWIEIPRLIRRVGASAFHSPSFDSFPWMPVPYMVTVHDLIHLRYGTFVHRIYYNLFVRRFIRSAQILATVSRAARTELANWIGYPESRIEVHPNAFLPKASRAASTSWLARTSLASQGYFLAVANRKKHKNLQMIRDAHNASGAKVPLVIAHEFLNQYDPTRQSPEAFDQLFENARMIVSPSLIEGFGRVPVEAVLSGVPVLLSAIPAHEEIFEKSESGVEFCSPTDFDCWVEAFKKYDAVSPAPIIDSLAVKMAQRFSLENLLRPVHEAYIRLVARGGFK